MIVCICHRVSDRDIARAVRDGCDSFDSLQDELGVATGCGACHDCASATFSEHAATRGLHCHIATVAIVPRRADLLPAALAVDA